VARVLAHLHPAWMLISLALAVLTLRAGLALRRARLGRAPRDPGLRRRHLRLAKPAVVLVLAGFVGGPLSAVWLRGWEPFASFHGALGLVVATLFAAAALIGRRLERGRSRAFQLHALLGALAVLGAALAAVAGFVLLP
jgi:polyferredoxin